MKDIVDKEKIGRICFYTFLAAILLLGIILRFQAFLINRPLWHDESSLALNIIESGFAEYFIPLKYGQAAPPLFMILTKIITLFIGIKEAALRLFPFLCSLISVLLFYYFSNILLKNRLAILLANFLFAVNYNLIYYSQEFKQYSSEAAICIVLFIVYAKTDIKEMKSKYAFILGIIAALSFGLAFPSVFITASWILYEIIKSGKKQIHKLIIFITPSLIFLITYAFLTILPQLNSGYLQNYWKQGFVTLNPLTLLQLLKTNLFYWFVPNQQFFCMGLFLTAGIIIMINRIQHRTNMKEYSLILFTLFFIILASLFHIYPFIDRISLYFIPFAIIIQVVPAELISLNKKILSGILILLILFTLKQYSPNYIKTFFNTNIFQKKDSRAIIKELSEKYDYKSYVLINDASFTDYIYYAKLYNFDTDKFGVINFSAFSEGEIFKILNSLPPAEYWFCFPNDYSHSPSIPLLKKWKENKTVEEELEIKGSYLIKVNTFN